jgi:hypothetical protein
MKQPVPMPQLNIINQFLLNAVLWPRFLYQKMGVDTGILRTILTYKLLMDDRRPNTFHKTGNQQGEKPVTASTLGTMLLSAGVGLLFITSFFVSRNLLTCGFLYFTMFIVMLALTLISDFTSVLIDVRDNFIILPKPVNDSTFIVSRMLHITVHVSKIMLPMAAPGIITAGIRFNPAASAALLLAVLLATLFTIFLINAMYLLVLRLATPEKFKNIIAGIQIAFAVIIYGAYQVVPRLFSESIINQFNIGFHPAYLLAPPYWFAAVLQLISQPQAEWVLFAAVFLALLMPAAGVWLVVRFFAPMFNRKLGQIAGSGGEAIPTIRSKSSRHSSRYSYWLAKWFTQPGLERESFLFSWKMMLRSREFKLKVYPGIGYLLVLAIMPVLRHKEGLAGFWQSLQINDPGSRFTITITLYVSAMVGLTALQELDHSAHHKASWIYRCSPLATPGILISGSAKAALAQFFIPVFLIIAIPLAIQNQLAIVVHLFTVVSLCLWLAAIILQLSAERLPWSLPIARKNQGTTVIRAMGVLIGLSLMGLLHGFLFYKTWLLWIVGSLAMVATWYSYRDLKKIGWKRIRANSY